MSPADMYQTSRRTIQIMAIRMITPKQSMSRAPSEITAAIEAGATGIASRTFLQAKERELASICGP